MGKISHALWDYSAEEFWCKDLTLCTQINITCTHMCIYLLIHTHQRGSQRGGRPEVVRFYPSEICLFLSASIPLEASTSTTSHCLCLFTQNLTVISADTSLKRNEHNIVSSQKKREERKKGGKKEERKERGKECQRERRKTYALYKDSLIVAILRLPGVATCAKLVLQIPTTVSVLISHLW